MNYRQIHLDFHTSEDVPGIGEKFSKKQFQKALQVGHVNSITLCAKCHHGWSYHPTVENEMHPNLKFDLLGAQIEAAHEIGVKAPAYLSAGYDEKVARSHPEWLVRFKDESLMWTPDFAHAGFHYICLNSPYLDYLLRQIKEVCMNYDADGIFLDIVSVHPCYCHNCVNQLKSEGKDPYDEKNAMELAERVYANYCKKVRETIDSVKPGLPVFHNGGHIRIGRRDLAEYNTHLELESLPTGGWGYDHFPLTVSYARNLGMHCVGMTGKFHQTWGEFGGFKHPNALRYEAALSIANGAGCSVGDQVHANGEMNLTTYELIGKAYKEVEEKEPWLVGAKNIADIAVLSNEAMTNEDQSGDQSANVVVSDKGAVRILSEGHYLFDVVDTESDFGKYKLLILPDYIRINAELKEKISYFVKNGGKIFASGFSAVNDKERGFEFDFGAEYDGINEYDLTYFVPEFSIPEYGKTEFAIYAQGHKIKNVKGNIMGSYQNPYFNRTPIRFNGHSQAPNNENDCGISMVCGNDGIYIGLNIFEEYALKGSFIAKAIVKYALDFLLGDNKTLATNLPSGGIATLTKQNNRNIVHLLYALPVKRGEGIEIIEDIVSINGINVSIKTDKKPQKVYYAPQMTEANYKYEKSVLTIDNVCFENHQMIVIENEVEK